MVLATLLRITNFQNPLLRTLVPTFAAAYAIQGLVAVPSIAAQTERFYDLSGSLTYLSCTALSLYMPHLRARAAQQVSGGVAKALPNLWASATGNATGHWDWRQLALSAAVAVWASRLGTHLFQRITADEGQDSRFEKIRTSPSKFLVAFMAQATWVSLCLLPVTAVNSLPPSTYASLPALTLTSVLGVALWVFGFTFEVIADRQKSAWVEGKKQKKHHEKFLTSGLWAKSRHPNYFGEITLWTGLAVAAAGVLASNAGQKAMGWSGSPAARLGACLIAGASPAFTTFLLTKISGIPLSETKYDKKYGSDPKYKEWKSNTPVLIPKF